MGIFSKLVGDDSAHARAKTSASSDYIDLSEYAANEKSGEAAASTYVRFAELRQLDDLKQFASYVYDGNMLVLDFGKVQGDEILLRRLTNELRKLAQDTGGDIAGLGDHHILLTPTGVKVDRRKLTAQHDEAESKTPMRMPAPAAGPASAPPAASAGASPRQNGARGARVAGGR